MGIYNVMFQGIQNDFGFFMCYFGNLSRIAVKIGVAILFVDLLLVLLLARLKRGIVDG